MTSRRRAKCLCCAELFEADVRNRGRQKYCAKGSCRTEAKASRQRRWLQKPENQKYFCGPEQVERVQRWRAEHPGYWRTHRRRKRVALQDGLPLQVLELPEDLASRALQDALRCQGPVLIGLIAHLSDSALQVDIAATTRGLLQLGRDILGGRVSDAPQTGAVP